MTKRALQMLLASILLAAVTACSTSRVIPYPMEAAKSKLIEFHQEEAASNSYHQYHVLSDSADGYALKIIMPSVMSYGKTVVRLKSDTPSTTHVSVVSDLKLAAPFYVLAPQEVLKTDHEAAKEILDAFEESLRGHRPFAQVARDRKLNVIVTVPMTREQEQAVKRLIDKPTAGVSP